MVNLILPCPLQDLVRSMGVVKEVARTVVSPQHFPLHIEDSINDLLLLARHGDDSCAPAQAESRLRPQTSARVDSRKCAGSATRNNIRLECDGLIALGKSCSCGG